MTLRSLPNWQTACQSEFGFGYTGDCTQTAEWSCFHTLDPATYPQTSAAIAAFVRYDQQHDGVGPTGAETAQQLAADLTARGVPFHQVFDATWQNAVATWGGLKPMIVQVLRAGGHLPGDEPLVNGHAIALLRWDPATATGWFCDGDHPNASAPVPYTLAELVAAQPFALTVLDHEIGQEDTAVSSVPFVKHADGSITYPAHSGVIPAITLDHGQAYYASTPSSTRTGCYPLRVGTYDPNGDSVVLWNDGKATRAVKATGWAIVLEDSGPRLAALLTEAGSASTLSQQNAALQQHLTDAQAQVKLLSAQVSTLQAQLAAPPAPPAQQTSGGSGAAITPDPSATASVAAVRAALAAVEQAAKPLATILGTSLTGLTLGGLLVALEGLAPTSDALEHTLSRLSQAVATLDAPIPPTPPMPPPPTQPQSQTVSLPTLPLGILRANIVDASDASGVAGALTGPSNLSPTTPKAA